MMQRVQKLSNRHPWRFQPSTSRLDALQHERRNSFWKSAESQLETGIDCQNLLWMQVPDCCLSWIFKLICKIAQMHHYAQELCWKIVIFDCSKMAAFNIIMTSHSVFMILVNLTYWISFVRQSMYIGWSPLHSQSSNFRKIYLHLHELGFYVTWFWLLLILELNNNQI